MRRSIKFLSLVSLPLLGAVVLSGCGKKQPTEAVQPAAADTSSVPVAAAPAEAAPETPTAAPVLDQKASLADADAAMKARDYERAAAELVAIQAQQKLSDQQAQAVRSRMVELQSSVAAGVASGDPKAVAAANLLRRTASGAR